MPPIVDSASSARKPSGHRTMPQSDTDVHRGIAGRSSRSVRAGSMSQRSRTGSNGAQRSPTVQRNRRSSPLRLRQQAEPPARVPYSGTAIAVWIGSLGASSSTTWSLFPVPGGRHRLPWALARTEGGGRLGLLRLVLRSVGQGQGTKLCLRGLVSWRACLAIRRSYAEGGVLSCGDRAFWLCWCWAPSPSW